MQSKYHYFLIYRRQELGQGVLTNYFIAESLAHMKPFSQVKLLNVPTLLRLKFDDVVSYGCVISYGKDKFVSKGIMKNALIFSGQKGKI